MLKKVQVLLIVTALLFAGIAVYALVRNDDQNSAVSSPPNNGSKTENPGKDGETVTKTGKVGCLAHKDTSGPVDAMCAIGLQLDDGTWYALGSNDPTTTGSIPTDTAVRVTGTLTTPETRYTSLGTITVTSVEKL